MSADLNPLKHSVEVTKTFIGFIRGALHPDLKDSDVTLAPISSFGLVALYGNHVFKKPNEQSNLGEFVREVRAQDLLKLRTNEAVAKYIPAVSVDGSMQPQPYVEMERFDGVPLTNKIILGLSPQQQDELAKDLSSVMLGIKSALTQNDIQSLGLMPHDGKVTSGSLGRSLANPRVKEALGDELYEMAQRIEPLYAEFLAKPRERIVTHGDLNYNNILVNPNTGKLVCVIDYGFIGLRSAERDFMNLAGYPTPFLKLLAFHYEEGGGSSINPQEVQMLRAANMLDTLKYYVVEERFAAQKQRVLVALPELLENALRQGPERHMAGHKPAQPSIGNP